MKAEISLITSALMISTVPLTHARAKESTLGIDDAVALALKHSSSLQAARDSTEAARDSASAVQAARYPKLSLDGNYRMQSVVPEVAVGPRTIQLTDDHNYSIGPTLSVTLWDSGLKGGQVRSLEAVAYTRHAQEVLTGAQIRLATRMAYVNSALTTSTLKAARQSESLSRTQNKDIQTRSRQGAASRLDALASDSEVLNYSLKAKQAESELQASLADLRYYLAEGAPAEVVLQSLEELSGAMATPEKPTAGGVHPLARIQEGLERSAAAQADSLGAAHWPIVNLQLRSSFDYPNGPSFEQIQQNTASVQFTWSLFEFGAVKKQVAAREADSRVAREQQKDILLGLDRDRAKALSRIEGLGGQIRETEQLVNKAGEVARMNYETYRYGKLSFSDVQTANLRLLDAKTRLAALRAQYLAQRYNLEFLTESE